MKKINFSGGEPFMEPDYLARALHLCHSRGCYTSIISNSSLITEEWLESNHKNLDMLGLSLDCSDDSINKELGRGFGHHVELVRRVAELAHLYDVSLKINTTVTRRTLGDDLAPLIVALSPIERWKLFQMLPLEGENSNGAARSLTVSKPEFADFVERQRASLLRLERPDLAGLIVEEDNETMENSYLIMDHNLCFLNCRGHAKVPTKPIPEIGLTAALNESGFDQAAFLHRGGDYFVRPSPAPASPASPARTASTTASSGSASLPASRSALAASTLDSGEPTSPRLSAELTSSSGPERRQSDSPVTMVSSTSTWERIGDLEDL